MRMQVVSPYRPFAPESDHHRSLGPFDWVGALEMLRVSVKQHCGCETYAITDVDTDLDVPAFQFQTVERRLMVWILEVSRAFLDSERFDRDTVMVSPDVLVLDDLSPLFGADLGVLIRPEPKHVESGRTILNQVQWWSHDAKTRLVAFYRQALDIARSLPEPMATWGGDTEPLRQLLEPLAVGVSRRSKLRVQMHHASLVMESLTRLQMTQLDQGQPMMVSRPLLDFRYTRKLHMRAAYDQLFPSVQTVMP
jgi:hypothetical protein